ncbi:MAG: DUF6754 domain-containing protein [Candidatus Limnocylindria bacterium]
MPDLGELIGSLLGFVGGQVAASSLRLGPVPTVALFGVMLILLSLVARPSTRWTVRDLGRLASVPRAMALAAESGADAAVSLGSAGIARGVSAADRIQTLAGLTILGHAARAAARSGVPLRVTANDPVAIHLAEMALADAHRRTATLEREERSSAEYLGEGRAVAAGAALADSAAPATAFVMGGLAEEALILLEGEARDAAWTSFGTASPSQAGSVLLTGEGALAGPELFQAGSDLRGAGHERTGVLAANRLLMAALAVIVIGSVAAVASGVDVAATLAGR